jgi:hypothetical protein
VADLVNRPLRSYTLDWTLSKYRGRPTFWTNGGVLHEAVPVDGKNIRLLARYWNAVKKATYTGDDSDLSAFGALPIFDLYGNTYQLLTDVNALMLLLEGYEQSGDFEQLFQSGEGVLDAA